jgi:hypothetical protein
VCGERNASSKTGGRLDILTLCGTLEVEFNFKMYFDAKLSQLLSDELVRSGEMMDV